MLVLLKPRGEARVSDAHFPLGNGAGSTLLGQTPALAIASVGAQKSALHSRTGELKLPLESFCDPGG